LTVENFGHFANKSINFYIIGTKILKSGFAVLLYIEGLQNFNLDFMTDLQSN